MAARPMCPSCSLPSFEQVYGPRFAPTTPPAILIPFCPHTPRHIMARAHDPRVQAELSDSIHSILSPQWLPPTANGHISTFPPSPVNHHISPESGELFSSHSSRFELEEMVVAFSPETTRPSAPPPTDRDVAGSPQYICPSAAQVRSVAKPLPLFPSGISPSSAASSMSSWDSSTRNAACSLVEDTSRPALPRAIVKPHRFRFRPIVEFDSDNNTDRGPSQHHAMDSSTSLSFSSPAQPGQRTPSAPPMHLIDHVSESPSSLDEALSLPRPLHTSTTPSLRQDLVHSLCDLQQQPRNAAVQRWLQSQPHTPSTSHQNLSYTDLCTALGIDSSDLSPSTEHK